MSLETLIKEKAERLNTVPATFEKVVTKSQRKIFDDMLSSLDKLKRKAGFIEMSKENLLLIDEITADIKKVVLGSDYIKAIKEFAGEFDLQAELSNEYFKQAFDFSETELTKQILINSKKTAVELLVGGVDQFTLPIKSLLNNAVSTGAGWSYIVKGIRNFTEGNADVDGKLYKYSKQIASDTLAISDNTYSNAIAEEIGAEWFVYTGGEIGGTRSFCHERNGKYYHKKEIEDWALLEWAGKRDGTDKKTIFSFRGGYSCKHSIMAVSILLVPKSDIQRNIDNGNFTPSTFEKKELSL